tara:strand:+ start:107931 stop:112925 length:4995 start_codon:yes stop_codon:yes gene_type:complete
MRLLITIILLILSGSAWAQNFEDDFSDGDFTSNPAWIGADSNFVIFDLNGNNVLRLNDNESASSYLSTPSSNVEGEWEFFVKIDGSSPSNGNRAEIFLMSDIADLSGAVNGYAVRIGQTGDDVFKIVRLDGGVQTTVLEDTTVFEPGGSYRIKVSRDEAGTWSLEVGVGYNGDIKNSGTTATDNTYTTSSFFGVSVTYTSTRVDDYYFDFKIEEPLITVDPILVDSFTRFSDTEIDLSFTRDIDFTFVSTSDFILNESVNPESFSNHGSNALRITFTDSFLGGENELRVSGIESSTNDTVLTDTSFTFFIFDEFEDGDVIINEFLKDPPTSSGLSEYVELKNTTAKYLNLKDWEIGDNNSLTDISDEDIVLLPDSFLVVTSNPEALIITFGEGVYIDVSLPALNNTTDQIRVFDSNGISVDSLEYTPDWGGVDVALERKSDNVSATFQANWGDSPSENFGTPGTENEVEADTIPPDIESYEFLNDSTVQLIFTEEIKPGPAENPDNYRVLILVKANPNAESAENEYLRATFFAPDTVLLEFDRPYYSYKFGNVLEISNQEDIFGNVAEIISVSYELVKTTPAVPFDIAINEFMYDPATGYSEFIELNSHTGKTINLKGWTISDNTGNHQLISNENFYVQRYPDQISPVGPKQYVILSSDSTINVSDNIRLVLGSRFPTLNNTTDAIILKNAEGVTIDSLTYSSSWGGNEVSLERKSVTVSGIYQANWEDSPSTNFGTPGKENEVELDMTPPDIESYEFLSDSTLQIQFTEDVKQEPAENPSNYVLVARSDNDLEAPEIMSIELLSSDTVIVRFESAFPGDSDGENFSLQISNQVDIFENVSSELVIEFEFREFDSAYEGAVVINEFMYDPIDDYSEFVEIYNWTSSTYNLKGWTFNDNSGSRKTITTKDYFLEPNQYLLLAGDSTIVETFPSTSLLDVSGFPALNNSSDDLVLRNENGLLIDSLTYFSYWGGEEVSLERRSANVAGIFQANWGDSPSTNFGTPGKANEIEPDTEAPFVESVLISDPQTILLKFNEVLVTSYALDVENYNLTPTLVLANIEVNSDSVTLSLSQALSDGEKITIEILNQRDVFGNITEIDSVEVTYLEILPAIKNEVVINEILYRRKDELSPEFIELFNTTEKNFKLSGWTLKDASSSKAILPPNTFLRAGEYLVITDREDFAQDIDNAIYLSSFPSLNDSGDQIIIKNSDEVIIDSLFYKSSWGGESPGVSVERKDPAKASNDASNWATSTAQSGFSAGVQSSVFEADISPPRIIFATQIGNMVRIVFSEFVSVTNETVFNVNGTSVELFELIDNEAIVEWTSAPETVPKNISASSNINVTVSNIADIKGNIATEISSPIASEITNGAVVINEIMYNPLANSEDNLPDQTEYIELYNRSNSAISLEGITLHDAPDEENEIRTLEAVSTLYKWIQPKGYFLIYSEDEAEVFTESKTARYFSLEDESDQFTMLVDRSSLSLASSDDAIYLADSTGTTIDSVFFDESWQNPNVFDTDGIALERINPEGESNSESNWSSSTHVSGGTPNAKNTIFQEPGALPESSGISFSPNPFSPDDDGFEDNLFINYTLDAPDYLLRVRIFDRYGREVRKLADGFQAGFEGSLIWDGLTEDRKKNRVGIYIVLFEAYNSANGNDRTFKETVVLARMF